MWQSLLWTTSSTGDGAAAGYTQAQTIAMFGNLLLNDLTDEGVLKNYANELDETVNSGAVPTIDIDTGMVWLCGFPAWGDASENLAVTKPAVGDTGFRVVARGSGGVARTIRLAVVMNTDGVNAIPALTQDAAFPDGAGTVWEIPLYSGVIDVAGDMWTDAGKLTGGVTDDRVFIHPNIEVETAMIGDDQVTAAKILHPPWELDGNAGTTPGTDILGTTDDKNLEVHINGTRAMLYDSTAGTPNLVGGHPDNTPGAGTVGAAIGGGGAAAPNNNIIGAADDYGTVAGGYANEVTGDNGAIGGGSGNEATADAAVAGGLNNTASGEATAISGGNSNVASGGRSAIGGGTSNVTSENFSVVPGGYRGVADRYGQVASAAGQFAAAGDAQGTIQMVARLAQAAHVVNTWYSLALDGAAQRMTIPASAAWTFEILLVGITQNAAQQFSYTINGLIERDNANNTTLAASNVTTIFESDANYDAQVIADDVNEALVVQVRRTGGVDYNVRWVATIKTSEVTFP